jgi:hypothetical protein
MKTTALIIIVLGGLALPLPAYADNTVCANAIFIVPSGSAHSGVLAVDGEVRWYTFQAKANRAYSITLENLTSRDIGAIGLGALQTDCAGTTASAWSTWDSEPVNGTAISGGDRRTVVATADTTIIIPVGPQAASLSFQIRVEETTLFSNWFFVGGDYSAFTLIRNTTASPVAFTILWRNSAGTIVASQLGLLAPNGSLYKNGRDFSGVLAAGSGTVEIIHNGTPDAIVASTTTLSTTTGLSFDSPFVRRVAR